MSRRPKRPLPLAELVEMDLGRVLIEPGRRLVLGLLDGGAVDMIDPLARAIVLEPMRRSAEFAVERVAFDPRTSRAETGCADRFGKLGNVGLGRRGACIAFSHHHPAHVVDHRLTALIEALRAHKDHAALPVRILLEPDHLRNGGQRIARKDRLQEPAIGIAEISDRVQRDVRHRLAEYDMEGEQIVDRAGRIADRASEGFRALWREARPGQRRIKRGVATIQRARRRVPDRLTEAKVLEEPA